VTKTRFKTWWDLVGWPMEFAAKLADITVDCTELLRAGEAEDDEASAVSVAISILREIWGEETFTAKDAVKILTPESKLNGAFVGIELDEGKKTHSDALADALNELSGKRLDRPTAHRLGKLFQKRLVGRPAWIQDGETVAILRKSTGHDENSYWVEVSVPGQAPDFRPCYPSAGKNIPHNPDIPGRRRAEEGKAGNVGKDGNVSPRATQQDGKTFGGGATEMPWSMRL